MTVNLGLPGCWRCQGDHRVTEMLELEETSGYQLVEMHYLYPLLIPKSKNANLS